MEMGSAVLSSNTKHSNIFFLMAFKVLSYRNTLGGQGGWTKPVNKKFLPFARLFIAYKEPNARTTSSDKSSYHKSQMLSRFIRYQCSTSLFLKAFIKHLIGT